MSVCMFHFLTPLELTFGINVISLKSTHLWKMCYFC